MYDNKLLFNLFNIFQIETLVSLWIEKKNSGGSYSSQSAENKHVVICLNYLEYDFITHFLNEFYSHRKNQVRIKADNKINLKKFDLND